MVQFEVLGPLAASVDGERIPLGGAVQERVLAMLLLEAGRVVPVSRLVEGAWEQEPPVTAVHQIRKAVADLRRRLPLGREVIRTDGPGYRISAAAAQLDLLEFGSRVRSAAQALRGGGLVEARDELRAALALWRGAGLSGMGGPVIEAAVTVLEERRLAAAEQFFELCLELGECSEIVAELRLLISEHPLRERLRSHLMLALYRSGRQAEALEEYRLLGELLVESLGINPGPELARLYEDILREAPELAATERSPGMTGPPAPAPAAPETAGPPAVPCMLPSGLSDFVGRERELAKLLDHMRADGPRGEHCTRIVAIDGMGGTGKTCLGVRAARRLAADFPDGQLSIDLRGFTPGETPMTPAAALDVLLRAVGVPGERIPDDLAGRAGLWQSSLAGRRMLLLLDNAADSAHIRPMLPNAPGCLVLVTSRARLVDLDSVKWVSVGLMAPGESAALIAEILGAERVAAEPEVAAELAELCGHLPLALRIAAARLRNRPRWTTRYMVERLRDESRRLDELTSGERSVAATLRMSYLAMDARCRTAFRDLGLHPGGTIDVHAAAALFGTDTREAESILELLLDAHLLQQPDMGLYTFHDLVRSFAQGLPEAAAAVERLLDYYLTAMDAVCSVLFPGRPVRPSGIPSFQGELPQFRDAGQAQEWLARERDGLLAAVALAERRGHDRHAVFLNRDLNFPLHAHGHFDELWSLGRIAVAAARKLDDPSLLCVTLSNFGSACWRLGRFEEGLEAAMEGRDIARASGDRYIEAHGDSIIGLLLSALGRHRDALPLLERAAVLAEEIGMARMKAEVLTMLSTLYEQWGRHEDAAAAARQAIEAGRAIDYRDIEFTGLTDLAFAQVGLAAHAEAQVSLERARALCDDLTSPGDAALLMALSAKVENILGDDARAKDFAARALALVHARGTQVRRPKVQNLVGALHTSWREYAAARELHSSAREAAATMRYRSEEAAALLGLAEAAAALGDAPLAAGHRAAAAELLDYMDYSEVQPAAGSR
ncbi:DNA-binding SARP family transcriptional activator [Streptomyces sp. 846.5]|nr:BTAD domain-containing putative transcriptional regulator [Streptomyces sp. 846.5]TDU03375.1 DNA-binding SARP family transcriptional activator [Streptomyces sp. 846.5]